MYETTKLLGSGDSCLVVEFSDAIEIDANIKLQCLRHALDALKIKGVRECVPTYRSLSVHYDPVKLSREKLEKIVSSSLEKPVESGDALKRVLVMPVAYGGEYGPDMANVSAHTGFEEAEIVKRYTARDYYCYMLGFTPGFSYLGGLDEALATPRLAKPRMLIPAGSVGIAGKQTGAYSIDSQGGWQIIGRTPLRLFDPDDGQNPTLIDAGDWIRFRSISRDEFESIGRDVNAGKYSPERFVERDGGGGACHS